MNTAGEEEARAKIKSHAALIVPLTSCSSRNPCFVKIIAKSPQLKTFILEVMVDAIGFNSILYSSRPCYYEEKSFKKSIHKKMVKLIYFPITNRV